MPIDKVVKTPKSKKRASAPKKKKTKPSSKSKSKNPTTGKTSGRHLTSTSRTESISKANGDAESSSECLRWWGQLGDPNEEAKRIESYKAKRRERYYQKAAEEYREFDSKREAAAAARTTDVRPRRRTYYYQSTSSVKMPNIYASPSAGTLCTTTAIQSSLSQLSTVTC